MSFVNIQGSRRALLSSAAALGFALTVSFGGVMAQDATVQPYEAPENAGDLSGTIVADGSSTVGPITEAMAEEFAGESRRRPARGKHFWHRRRVRALLHWRNRSAECVARRSGRKKLRPAPRMASTTTNSRSRMTALRSSSTQRMTSSNA